MEQIASKHYGALLRGISTLPAEVKKHCMSYIPCNGITEREVQIVQLSELSQVAIISRRLRPWFGCRFKYPSGDTYVIAEASRIETHIIHWSPIGGCWYPIASNYVGDGEYRSLCIHETGECICEWEFGKRGVVHCSDLIRLYVLHHLVMDSK